MKFRNLTVFTLLLLAAVVLAFAACSSSTGPTGTSKGVVFEVDEDGNSSHPDGWEDLHQDTSPGDAAFCAGCHASEPAPEPGCSNNTLCHGAEGDDSDELDGDSDELEEDSDELEEDSDEEVEEDSDEEEE